MKRIASPVFLAALLCAAPAFAQLAPGGALDGGGSPGGGPAPQPQARVPDIAPPALPGAGQAPLATGPQMQHFTSGDPTQALFDAINKGDYNAAQEALGRGASLTTQNALGETPLDLSVALNRSSITFLLLATRNETGGDSAMGAPMTLPTAPPAAENVTPVRQELPEAKPPIIGDNPGTPNPSAGFLGFGPKS